jgi:hypothetical protein
VLIIYSCECGAEFCYICGESWPGMHACPHYGPAIYDEEGYNQDGYHRVTGLNRDGHTRQEQAFTNADGDDEDEEGEVDDDPDDHHFVLQHVDAAMRATFAALPHQDREAFLLNLQIQLFEERGITFDLPDEHGQGDNDSDDGSEHENIDDLDGDNHLDDLVDPDEERDGDSDVGDQNNAGAGEDLDDEGQNNAPFLTDNAPPSDLDESLQEIPDALDAIEQGTGDFHNGASSSAASPAADRPATPMDIAPLEQSTKHEHEPWTGAPASWPEDEKL